MAVKLSWLGVSAAFDGTEMWTDGTFVGTLGALELEACSVIHFASEGGIDEEEKEEMEEEEEDGREELGQGANVSCS